MRSTDSFEKTLMLGKIEGVRRRGQQRMRWLSCPLTTQWIWLWANSGSWWWTGKPGVLLSMGMQGVRHDWVTELKWTEVLPLSHPKRAFHISGNCQTASHQVAPRNLVSFSAWVTWCLSCMRLRDHLSLSDWTVESVGHFCPLFARRDHWEKRVAFLSAGDSPYPHSMAGRLRVGSGTSWEPLRLTPWLHSQKL